ncbi:alpha/beta-hydrolase [Microthyrium microscopicum]|uniref:Alpha/beta-hydrolase n=1 Tax=Microthyrium microscopicum TaxID=703497 RepID=A0A6A6UPR5_9PEZI|nr:alpha/beta-hydrolase [Microthyrium microscopicum]
MANPDGVLFVTMQPKETLALDDFNDWYNNEHGPNRLRLAFVENGFRYKAIDGLIPEFMAIYDIKDMSNLEKEIYTKLRAPPVQTQRERDTMKQITILRRFYDLVQATHPTSLKADNELLLVAISSTESPHEATSFDFQGVRGWKSTRTFKTSQYEAARPAQDVQMHAFDPTQVEEVKSQLSKLPRNDVDYRLFQRFYTFGAAPRDHLSPQKDFTFPDGLSKVLVKQTGGFTAIESYITTSDGVVLPYRLEGHPDSSSPMIVLINSILVDWRIWDKFIEVFFKDPRTQKYQILRFNARGRSENTGPTGVTVDTLASDVIELLDTLTVPKAAAVIGVSLGGATALNVALRSPDRLDAFISCDTNALAPPGNPKAWNERIEMAEKEGKRGEHDVAIVGEDLAEATVRRWFTADSYTDADKAQEIARVKSMVETNVLAGFKGAVKALYEYDFRAAMKSSTVRGMFLVGASDGALPKTMKDMAASYGDGSSLLAEIEGAGHLPMVEQPEQFTEAVARFLNGN